MFQQVTRVYQFYKNVIDLFSAKSLLSRLMEMPTYNLDISNSQQVISKLKSNYRNHEDILYLPNELFYDGELEVSTFLKFNHLR